MNCQHPPSDLEDPSIPSVGDTISGKQVGLEAHCTGCDQQVIIDARIQDVMSK